MEKSPLTQVQPDSLSELFARDPLQLADQDILKIVLELRKQREAWRTAEAAGAKSAPKNGPKSVAPPGMDLKDIGL